MDTLIGYIDSWYNAHSTLYIQIFEGQKFQEFRGRQHFHEILVLHIRILSLISLLKHS